EFSMNPSIRLSFLLCLTILFILSSAQVTYQGCYSIDDTLVLNDTSIYQSKGRCSGQFCGPQDYPAFGLTAGGACLCGYSIPGHQVTADKCNSPCPGYPNDTCTFSSANLNNL